MTEASKARMESVAVGTSSTVDRAKGIDNKAAVLSARNQQPRSARVGANDLRKSAVARDNRSAQDRNKLNQLFQSAFDGRINRLTDEELQEIRTIFRFYDTDRDGAITANEACRILCLLGVDVNMALVSELGDVFLPELVKIIDNHVPRAAAEATIATTRKASVTGENAFGRRRQSENAPGGDQQEDDADDLATSTRRELDQQAKARIAAQALIQQEWLCLDTFRKKQVSVFELWSFFRNCQMDVPSEDLVRLFELYGEIQFTPEQEIEDEEIAEKEPPVLKKKGFELFHGEHESKERLAQTLHVGEVEEAVDVNEKDDGDNGASDGGERVKEEDTPETPQSVNDDEKGSDGREPTADPNSEHSHQTSDGQASGPGPVSVPATQEVSTPTTAPALQQTSSGEEDRTNQIFPEAPDFSLEESLEGS